MDLPAEFDAREHFKDCMHEVRNQGKCGSCWAFAASEAFSDRACIASKGQVNEVFSPEGLVECDKSDMACKGGELFNVWNYLEKEGVVTETCKPYRCGEGQVAECTTTCEDPTIPYKRYKCK